MKKLFALILISISLANLWSCKNEKNTTKLEIGSQKVDTADIVAFYPLLNQKKLNTMDVYNFRKNAALELENRIKALGNKSYTIIDKDIWAIRFVVHGSDISKPEENEGKWIDFKEDLTYTYGYQKETNGGGRYHYHFEEGIILMLDNDENIKPSEFGIKPFNDVLIFEGKFTYSDNNMQGKLERIKPY